MQRTMTGLLAIGFGLQACGPASTNSTSSQSGPNAAEDVGNAMNAAAPANAKAGASASAAMTAGDATALANAEVARMLPRMDMRRRTIRADEADDHWRISYESADDIAGGGPVIVRVDKRTRQPAVVQIPQ